MQVIQVDHNPMCLFCVDYENVVLEDYVIAKIHILGKNHDFPTFLSPIPTCGTSFDGIKADPNALCLSCSCFMYLVLVDLLTTLNPSSFEIRDFLEFFLYVPDSLF